MMNSDSSGATSADSDIKKSATVSRDRDRDHDQDLIDLWGDTRQTVNSIGLDTFSNATGRPQYEEMHLIKSDSQPPSKALAQRSSTAANDLQSATNPPADTCFSLSYPLQRRSVDLDLGSPSPLLSLTWPAAKPAAKPVAKSAANPAAVLPASMVEGKVEASATTPLKLEPSSIFRFMDLPGELRNRIYFFALKSDAITKLVRCRHQDLSSNSDDTKIEEHCGPNVCLLRANRQVYMEATVLFYAYNTFSVCATGIGYAFSSTARRCIKHLEVFFEEFPAQKLKPDSLTNRMITWQKAIEVIDSLPALERVTVNFRKFYVDNSAHATLSSYERSGGSPDTAHTATRHLVQTMHQRREAGRGNVELESINLSFDDFRWIHSVLYPESNK